MNKIERDKLRDFIESNSVMATEESWDEGLRPKVQIIKLLDSYDQLEKDYSDHMVVYEALLDEQKKTEELETKIARLVEALDMTKTKLLIVSGQDFSHNFEDGYMQLKTIMHGTGLALRQALKDVGEV